MDMYEKLNVWLEDQKSIEEYVISRTKITLEELHQNKNNKQDWYFNFDDAIKYGIINGLEEE
jgi:ATP-dependent protease ClpP protease subunit